MDIQELANALKIQTGTIVAGWLLFVLGLIFKDIMTSLSFGILFYLNPQFQEGDVVYIDDDKAIIQKIGITTTIFKISKDGKWRYVRNERIGYHKLEKQIEETE